MLGLLAPAAAAYLVYECSSESDVRGFSHRTLKMPQSFVDRASASDISSYGAKLCCVYTRIDSTPSNSIPVEMINMDGSNSRIYGTTFAAVAQNAYDAVTYLETEAGVDPDRIGPDDHAFTKGQHQFAVCRSSRATLG